MQARRGRQDAAACAAIFNAWVDATDWMPRVHPPEDVERHYREHVLSRPARCTVAERDGAVAGFLALDGEGYVAALYLAPERAAAASGGAARGGEGAAAGGADALDLRRQRARRGGSMPARASSRCGRTDGENEEGLPDVLLAWRAAA